MAKNNKSGLTLKNRIGYGCGDAGGVMTFMLMSTFFTRYCLNILGVSSAVLATLLLIWNIWDAVNDPLMGALMERFLPSTITRRESSVLGFCAPRL